MKAKITDVARLAGVSIATVSNVINDTRPVCPQTRQRVLDAITALQYVPDRTARHFKAGRKSAIGFIVPDIGNMFFSTLINAIEEVLGRNGYDLIIANTHENTAREAERLRQLCSGTVDALIIASSFECYNELLSCMPANFPAVLVDRIPYGTQCDTIRADSHDAILKSIDYLAECGHTRIGMLAWQEPLSTTRERVTAYRYAMAQHGLEPLVRFVGIDSNTAYMAESLLAENCTALLVSNSKLYIDLMGLLNNSSARPALVCFCDTPEFQCILHGLPIILQPSQEIGRLAGRMILERLQDPHARTRDCILQCTFQPPAHIPRGNTP